MDPVIEDPGNPGGRLSRNVYVVSLVSFLKVAGGWVPEKRLRRNHAALIMLALEFGAAPRPG